MELALRAVGLVELSKVEADVRSRPCALIVLDWPTEETHEVKPEHSLSLERGAENAILSVFNLRSCSQAGRRRFDPGPLLQQLRQAQSVYSLLGVVILEDSGCP